MTQFAVLPLAMVERMHRKFRLRILEWLAAVMLVTWGVMLSARPDMFQSGFYAKLKWASESEWSAVSMLLGLSRISALMKEMVRAAIRAFLEDVPQVRAPTGPLAYDTDIIPWANIGDGHLGMLAHEAEVGENFDLKIGERELCGAIGLLIAEMQPHKRIVINDLGDMTHYENMTATTEASGHVLDYDSRFPKMIRVYSQVMRFIIDKALEKCRHLDVIINRGNHSDTNDIWMAELLPVAYGHTGRVNVLDNDSMFIAYRIGKTLVMTHHSHKTKPANLASVLASDYAEEWGQTEYRMVYLGHIHQAMALKELSGCVVESFNTLAGKDRWAHDGGYRARQSITVIQHSRTYGEVGRRVLPIQQVRDYILAGHTGAGKLYMPPQKAAYAV